MLVGLQITSRLCCKEIAEGLEEKLNTINANFKLQIRQF